jgi:hypothetical protein
MIPAHALPTAVHVRVGLDRWGEGPTDMGELRLLADDLREVRRPMELLHQPGVAHPEGPDPRARGRRLLRQEAPRGLA